jgi:hypothetical protein
VYRMILPTREPGKSPGHLSSVKRILPIIFMSLPFST